MQHETEQQRQKRKLIEIAKRDPSGWVEKNGYLEKWDEATRTVIRKPNRLRNDSWNDADVPD